MLFVWNPGISEQNIFEHFLVILSVKCKINMFLMWERQDINTIRIKLSENKQQPGVSRSGCSQWEEAKLASAVEKLENLHTFFSLKVFP